MNVYQTIVTIAAAGTPQVIINPPNLLSPLFSKLTFRPAQANTGAIYVGLPGMVKATDVNVLMPISPPQAGQTPDTWPLQNDRDVINPQHYLLDADVSGEKIVVIFQQES